MAWRSRRPTPRAWRLVDAFELEFLAPLNLRNEI